MKIWVDDVRPSPNGYVWCKSVYAAINLIEGCNEYIDVIDIDHDAGDFCFFGRSVCLLYGGCNNEKY